MRTLFILLILLILHGYSIANEGLVQTINYQGFIQSQETGAPVNNIFSMHFYIHPEGDLPPFNTNDDNIWHEFYEKISVKDGVFFQRLGVYSPLTKGLFRTDTPKELTIKIVPFGTNEEASYLGPMSIDGNPYSVSSVAKKGPDTKEGTLKIIPFRGSGTPNNVNALIEIFSPEALDEVFHNVEINWTRSEVAEANIGKGLIIDYPDDMNVIDYEPTSSSSETPWDEQLISPSENVEDIAVYIENGKIELGGSLTIKPYTIGTYTIPGDLYAAGANVTGNIRVNDLITEGTIRGPKLEYCDPQFETCIPDGSKYADYLIDPYPTESVVEYKPSLINALEIGSKDIALDGSVEEDSRGEFALEGPLQTSEPAYIKLSGTDSLVYTPKLVSPYPSTDSNVNYQISPGGLSILDSLLLITRTDISRDPNNPEYIENVSANSALKSPLNAYSLFELLSTAPVCGPPHGKDKWYMALREDYCDAKEGINPDDKYESIDPCQGIANSQLDGYDLACADTLFSDHPNFVTQADNPSEGQKFFAGNHVHNVLEEATAKMLVDIINASSLRIDKKLLPSDAVNKTVANTLTGVNVFQEIRAADKVVAAMANGLEVDAYIGTTHLSKEFPAQIGSLNSEVNSIEFIHESTNVEVGLNIAAGDSTFDQTIEIGRHLNSRGDLNIEKNPSGIAGGNLKFNRKAGGRPPYFYMPGETVISGDISFPTTVGVNQRVMSGMSSIKAERFVDLDDQSYVILPREKSILQDLTVTGELIVDYKMNVEGSAEFSGIVSAEDYLFSNLKIKAERFSDLDNSSYFVEPSSTSVVRKLLVANELLVKGNFTLESDLKLSGLLTVNNFESQQNLIVQDQNGSVNSRKILDKNSNSDYLIDPSETTKLHSIQLKDDGTDSGGNLNIDGNLILSNALDHQGSANIQGFVTASNFVNARKFIDQDNNSYSLDPNDTSTLQALHISNSYENTQKTTVSDRLLVSQNVSSNSSLVLNGNLDVEDNLSWKNGFSITHSGVETLLSIDSFGNITAGSLTLDSDLYLEDLETLGSLSAKGGDLNFNADTRMDKFTVITSSLISMHPSTYQTVFQVDPSGHMTVKNDVNFKGKLQFAEKIDITTIQVKFSKGAQNTLATTLRVSDQSNDMTTVNIGITGQKDLQIAGLDADRLEFTTATFNMYRDLDAQSSRYIDPSSESLIETLEIVSSLYTENSLTAPFAVDLENQYILDPNQETRLKSLEVLGSATAEQVKLSNLVIDTQNQSTGVRILDADSLLIHKSQDISFTGSSYFRSSSIHVNQNSGLKISSSTSAGMGILMTPGDLDVLINKKNADYLHHHDLFGGVDIYDLARRDINNSVPDNINPTAATKALHGQYVLTSEGMVMSVKPDLDSGTKPLFAVYSDTGSLLMGALSSGTVIAQTFKGSGAEVSNIAGAGTSYSAILSATIDSIKIKNSSLIARVFNDNIITNEKLPDGTINSSHIQANTFNSNSILANGVFGVDLNNKSILNRHIKAGEIDGTLLQNESIESYHLLTDQISITKIQSKTLSARVFANQAFDTEKIVNQSIITTHISKGAVDSNKIVLDSLIDANFDDLSIATGKIKQDAVQNSEIAQLTLTNSDFGSDSITSVKILDLTIIESNISTNTLSGTALANNSVDFSKLVSLTIRAEDIENSTITSSSNSAQHKISNEAITSEKIKDRNIIGANLAPNILTSSHIPTDTVSDLQFDLSSIAHEDIKTADLTGVKIQNLSISARMFDDEVLLADNIQTDTFESNSVSADTLSSKSFVDAAVTQQKISDNTVSSTNIVNLSLLDQDFGSNSLVVTKWLTDTISTVKINDGAITLIKFATSAIISSKVSDHAISTQAIKPGNISTEHWSIDTVTESKFANASVTEGHLLNLQIDARIAAPNSILSSNIKNLAIDSSHIPDDEIQASKIADNAVTSSMIKDGQLNESQFGRLSIISSNFKLGSVTNIHIDLNTLSSRVIAEKQVLTTHIKDAAITNSRIRDSQIDSRVVFDSAVTHSLIESYALETSDFKFGILTDSQIQSKAITAGKIADNSIAENLWVSGELYSYHVNPYTITSASLDDQIITSAKIASQTISGSHIENFSLTDLDIASDALVTAVFDIEVVTSGQIKDNSLLAEDFAALSLLTTHYDSRIFENSHFSDDSILTTHIIDFTLRSAVVATNAITEGKIDDRSATTHGFKAVSKAPNLTNPTQILELKSGQILVFDNTHGIYRLDNAATPILSKVSSLTGAFGKAMTREKRVWITIGSKIYGSAYEGHLMRELEDFGSAIQDFYFEDEFHGIITTDSKAYYTYDGGQSFRLVKTGSSFRKVFCLSDLQHSWLIKSDGQTLYSTNEYLEESVLSLNVGGQIQSYFSFWMHSSTDGLFLDGDTLVNTSDNWSNDGSNTQINSPFFFSDSSGNNIFITTAGLSRYTLWSNLAGSTDTSFSEYSSPSLVAEAAHISETDSWVILYKHTSENDYFVAKTNNQGSSYSISSLGITDSNLSKYTRLQSYDDSNLFLTRGNHSLKSNNSGMDWSSQNLNTPRSHAYDIYFVDADNGFAVFDSSNNDHRGIYKTINGGTNWSLTSQTVSTAHLLAADDTSKVFSAQFGGTQLWASNDGFSSKISTSFGGAILQDLQMSSGTAYFSGSNGLLGKVNAANFSDISTYVGKAGETFTAVAKAGTSIVLGSSSSKMFLVTGFGKDATQLTAYSGSSRIYDVCARDENEFLAIGLGSDTKISFDQGASWDKLLDEQYDSVLFSSCYWKDDGTIILGAGNDLMIFTKHGEGIESLRVSKDVISNEKLESGFNSEHLIEDTIENNKFSDNSINDSKILTDSLIESKIANNAVSSSELNALAIVTRAIQDEAITHEKMGSDIDAYSKIGDDVLTGGDFSDLGSIDYALIQSDSIDSRLFSETAANQLTDGDLDNAAIQNQHLDHYSLHGKLIKDSQITSVELLNASISAFNIQSGVLTSDKIQADTFDTRQIASFAISASQLADGSIVTATLADKEFWSDAIKDSELSESSLKDDSFEGKQFKSRVFNGNLIEDASVDFNNLVSETIRAAQIKNNSIAAIDFDTNSITSIKLEIGAINTSLIATGSVKGEFIKDGDIESSKIHSQAISGVLLIKHTIESDKLQSNTFKDVDLAKGEITKTKISTRTLSDSHFENLASANFSSGSFGTKGGRLYQSDSTSVYVQGANISQKTLASHGRGAQLSYSRISPDGSKVAFISGGDIYWADRTFDRVRATGLSYEGTTNPFLIWSNDNRIIYHFDNTNNEIYGYNIISQINTQETTVSGGGSKLVFNPDDLSEWVRLNANGTLTSSDGNCQASGNTFTELEISQTDAIIFVARDGDNELGYCTFEGTFSYTSNLDSNAEHIKANPLKSDRLFYFQGNDLHQIEIPFDNARKILTAGLTGASDKSSSWVFSGHVLEDDSIENDNLEDSILSSSHLADLSIIANSFSDTVIASDHIKTDAVESSHIAATTLNESVFASAVITAGNLKDLTLEGKYFKENSIIKSRILSADIRASKVGTDAVGNSELDESIISESKVASKSILTTHMMNEVVSNSSMIANSIIDESFIKTKEVSSFHVVNSAINSAKISAEQIYPRVLDSEAITESKIMLNSLLGEDFDAGVITPSKLKTNAFDKGDGFIVTIENGELKRYNWDGSNSTSLDDTKTWSKIQNTAYGNRISVFAEDQSYEMSFISGDTTNSQYRPVSARSIISTTDNKAFVMGGNSWVSLTNPGTSFASGAYAVANSKLYLFGGNNGSLQSAVRKYDPISLSWSNKTSMSGGARSDMVAVELDGLIYVIGGQDNTGVLARVEIYDPVADSWSNASDLPVALYSTSAVAIDGRIYVFGGNDGSNNVSSTYEYNPGSDSWSLKANMPGGDRSSTTAAVYNDKAYVFGGNGASNVVEEYDPQGNSWSNKANLPIGRSAASAVTLGDEIYLAAGSGSSGELNILKKYDPVTNTWSGALDNLASSVSKAAIAAIDGLIYLVGGTSAGSAQDQMQMYFKGVADHLWIYKDGAPNTRIDTGVVSSAGMDYSPETNKLAYIAQVSSDNLIRIYDGSSASTELNLGGNSISKPVFNKDGTKLFFIQGNTIQKRVLGNSTSEVVDTGDTITDLRVSIETDKVYYISNGNIFSFDTNSTSLIDATENISEFEIIPYSMFDEDEINNRLDSGVFDAKHIASRLFDDTSFAAGTLDEDELTNSVITGAVLTNDAITASKYSGAVDGTKIASQAIQSSNIVNGSIATSKILDGGLESRSIASGALAADRLSGSIDGIKIENLTITGLKFQENSIKKGKIQTDSITQSKLKDDQISSANLANFTLQTADFKSGDIEASVIADRVVTDGNLQVNQIESSKIKSNTLTDSVFGSAAVTYGHIKTSQINNEKLANNTLQNDNFYFNSIAGDKLEDDTLTQAMLSNEGIHGDDLEGSIANIKIKAASLKGEDVITETINVSKFNSKTVTGGAFGDGILSASQIADDALTLGNIANDTIDGSQLADNAVTSTKIKADTFDSSNFDDIFTDSKISNLTLNNADFSTDATKKLTSNDFETIYANWRTVVDSSIQTGELAEDILVKSSGDGGLRLADDNIIQDLLEDNTLTGDRFAEQAITKNDISDNSLSVSRIKSFILTESKLNGRTVAESDLATAAIIQLNIADQAITAGKLTDNSFNEDDIYQIGGDEIQNLSGIKLKTDSIGSDLLSNLTSREIGLLETADLKDLTFNKDYFKNDGISTESIDSSSKLTQDKFKNEIPASRIKANDIPYAKLNVGDGTDLAKIFGGEEANSEHQHNSLLQTISACSDGYILVAGDSQEAFCMSTPAEDSQTISEHKTSAHNIQIDGLNIRGNVCTIQQLIRAVEDGIELDSALASSSFTIEANGFGATLKLFKRNNLSASGSGGLGIADVSSTQTYDMRYCY